MDRVSKFIYFSEIMYILCNLVYNYLVVPIVIMNRDFFFFFFFFFFF